MKNVKSTQVDNFEKIIGYEKIKKELRVVADIIKDPQKYMKLGATVPMGVLLVGPPGTGKSTLAEAFLKECECETITLRKQSASDELVFEINSAFQKAKKNDGYTVILLDDLDKFENNDEDDANADCFVTLQSNIDEAKQEGTKVVVLVTANRTRSLPPSLLRKGRIDITLRVGRPCPEDAKKIVEYYLKDKKCKDIDTEAIVKILNGANCASLESIINQAAIIAVRNNKEFITMDEINRAALREIFGAPEITEGYDKKQLHMFAVHEAGHAVAAEALYGAGAVNIVALTRTDGYGANAITSVYGGECPGVRMIEDYENRIMVALAGRAATEIMLSRVDTGTCSDLNRANHLIHKLATEYCVWGFEHCNGFTDNSSKSCSHLEMLLADKTSEYYERVKRVLIKNKTFLETMVAELEKKIVITREDIEDIQKKIDKEAK